MEGGVFGSGGRAIMDLRSISHSRQLTPSSITKDIVKEMQVLNQVDKKFIITKTNQVLYPIDPNPSKITESTKSP